MKKLNIDKVVSRLENTVGLVHASLIDTKKVTDNLYKVIVAFSDNGTKDQRFLAVAKLFDNYVSPVENSFRELAGTYKPTSVGFVRMNTETREFTKEMASSGRYKALAGNALMDAEDESLWEVTSSGDQKFLVRTSKEDLSELVSLASLKQEASGRMSNVTCASLVENSFIKDYVSYVHPTRLDISHGFIVSASAYGDEAGGEVYEILDEQSQEVVEVDPELVVESATLNGDEEKTLPEQVVASFDQADANSLKAYYLKVFGYSPDYVARLNSIIDSHATV